MSDNGKHFDNPKFRDFYVELGIKNYYSSQSHPQSNGQAEVTIRTLKATLKTKLENLKGKWVEYLPEVLWPTELCINQQPKKPHWPWHLSLKR